MAQGTIQERKRHIYERTSVDVALSEDEAEKLFRYFNFAAWSMENSFSTVLSPSKHAKDGRMSLQDQLKGTGYKPIQYVRANKSDVASHVLAVHYGKKEVVLSISFGHLASEKDSVVRSLESGVEPPTKLLSIRRDHCLPIYARENLLLAAESLSDDTFHLVEHLFIPNGFRVILCGHSLGAGVAGLVGVLWKDFCRTRDLFLDLQVYAFGPPPCLSQSFCIETESYLTTVINNNDCLPRLSTNSLSSLETHLALVDTRLKMCSLSPRDMLTAKRNLSDILKLSKMAVLSPQDIMPHSGGLAGDEGQLAVPGKILCVWNHIEDANIVSVSCPHVDSPLLKDFFLDSSMMYDHTVDAYRANLELLAEQTANTI
ncbi:lipase class 3 [Nitzschia inconspicua]|uniref:Lipase class 3 n=1 Tax=Nitzschia inconspicua TaxID=303405 RepID=A0A9K3M0Q5_9STRA|nr:lipase class 3 [Nitzschia inconspicua]